MPLPSGYIAPAQLVLGRGPIYRTSRPYAIQNLEYADSQGTIVKGIFNPVTFEFVDTEGVPLGGTLRDVFQIYNNYQPEEIDTSALILDGTMGSLIVIYDNYQPEEIDSSALVLNSQLIVVLITYNNYQPEEIDASALILDGTMGGDVYIDEVLADSPVAYYRCGESSGGTLVDEINPPTQNGSIVGTVSYSQTGAISGDTNTALAVTTNSQSDYLEVPIELDMQSNGGMAIELWIDWVSDRIVFRDQAPSGGTLLFDTSGTIFVRLVGTTFNTGLVTNDYRDGNYHHWVVEYNHSTGDMNLYIDGVLEYTSSASLSGTNQTYLRFARNGNAGGNIGAVGTYDEIALYDAPLGLARVQAHYNAGV